ncbi:undecaprenyl-diphosphatase [Lewinella aquimaris]|uniref:Undecaprenyl-diphosphatase n=1 Tax=Neolewinella aquimaris TaxID=1835722 RepID=A0A840E721_9BACT|nr:phosphatase PAP2 family protein [Neolewinella aquimaris]MBB4077878.1 undecaprenyl-diphosphatase [Neolewinella aquimaris]
MDLDHTLFEFFNQQLANPFLDAVLPVYRDKTTWIPLYVTLLYLIWRSYGIRRTLYLVVCIAVVIAVADQLAAGIIKPWVGRLRPCATPELADRVRTLVNCGGVLSFPSNHATNHFALATVLSLTWVRSRGWRTLLFVWALTISLAQVYVGKHFVGDVIAGGLLGSFIGLIGVLIYRRVAGREAIVQKSGPVN